MRPLALAVLTALLSLVLCVGAAEVALRLLGHRPWHPISSLPEDLPPLHEPHPELGWRNREGRAVWPGLGPDRGKDIVMTFWGEGLRATAPERSPGRPRVAVLGGSFTQSWAVTDEESWAWRLQAARPRIEVLNFGTAGYGTLQSLLALEQHLAASPQGLRTVVYGFVDFHENRNVATASWLAAVSSTSRVGRLAVPRASLAADGSLVRHAPEPVFLWPLRGRLALVALLEERATALRARGRPDQAVPVTEALVGELDALARRHGARLLVVFLHEWRPGALRQYRRAFAARGVASAACLSPPERTDSVPVYRHPGRERNAFWAECVDRQLDAAEARPEGR